MDCAALQMATQPASERSFSAAMQIPLNAANRRKLPKDQLVIAFLFALINDLILTVKLERTARTERATRAHVLEIRFSPPMASAASSTATRCAPVSGGIAAMPMVNAVPVRLFVVSVTASLATAPCLIGRRLHAPPSRASRERHPARRRRPRPASPAPTKLLFPRAASCVWITCARSTQLSDAAPGTLSVCATMSTLATVSATAPTALVKAMSPALSPHLRVHTALMQQPHPRLSQALNSKFSLTGTETVVATPALASSNLSLAPTVDAST